VAKTKVVWTTNARVDLTEIGSFIAQDSLARAIEFTQRLFESTIQLEDFPLSGSHCLADPTCRQLVVENYRIIYEVSTHGIDVLTIISPGRDAARAVASAKKR
jgi:addiction module RelE/StbE family toxin